MESEIKEVIRIVDKSDLNSLFAYEEIFATFLYLNHFSFTNRYKRLERTDFNLVTTFTAWVGRINLPE